MSYIPFSYPLPFRVEGDNPPTVVAANGEAVLSMLWPIHDQTPEAEASAVAHVEMLAKQIAEALNKNVALGVRISELEKERDAHAEAVAALVAERSKALQIAEARVAELERDREKEIKWLKEGATDTEYEPRGMLHLEPGGEMNEPPLGMKLIIWVILVLAGTQLIDLIFRIFR